MDTSTFSDIQQTYSDAELLPFSGSTCDCYRVRLYGKLHFLKRLKPELCTDPRYVATIHKEFETGFSLDHPNLVRYISCGEDYLLTEYIDGETLKDFLVSHPDYFKSRQHADRFLSQLLDVLAYLHSHQVVHLDLKPDNILITRIDHDVKLTDLGFCYTDTYTDTMGRTDKYAAPEQFPSLGKEGLGMVAKPDARTDIYAFGKILETLPCSNKHNKVIARCTAKEPSDRYQSVEELQEALKAAKPYLKFAILLAVLLVGMAYLFYRVSPVADIAADKHGRDTVVIFQREAPPASPAPSNASVEHESKTKTSASELSDAQKKEIRKTTLAIVRSIYQSKVEPFVRRVIQGDYDNRFPYITPISDSLSVICNEANQEVYAALRKKDLKSRYPEITEVDVNTEFFNAIGDIEHYYSQTIQNHFYHKVKLPPNPFDEQ